MADILSKLTVFFEDPFWVGVYELVCGKTYRVCKITFGAEPKDREVYDFLLQNRYRLKFSPPAATGQAEEKRVSPKRMQREIEKQLHCRGTGTKAQQALQQQREQNKAERHVRSREQKEKERKDRFEMRRCKQKEKRRGH